MSNTSAYRWLARPILFSLPSEVASSVADFALSFPSVWRLLARLEEPSTPRIPASVGGLRLKNPIGLAAGYDKRCHLTPALSTLGFGYITCGTVTLSAWEGNPKPRLLRDTRRNAIINSFGFPNPGLESAAKSLERDRSRVESGVPVVVSVSGVRIEDIVACHRRLEPLVDAVEINISSPNTAGLRMFHDPRTLAEMLGAVDERKTKPLFVKMPPFAESAAADAIALAETCADAGVDALSVSNTRPVEDARLAVGSGGLSGKPIFGDTLRMVGEVRRAVGGATAIHACGGVFDSDDARRALDAGADTVQLLTGMVYRGPRIARHIARGLAASSPSRAPSAAPSDARGRRLSH